jgi:hypothetical protein
MAEEYLGDGLYASFDGFGFKLRTRRDEGDHWVYLEWDVLAEFDRYREQVEARRKEQTQRNADRIDGYDRDDLGESPDY